MEIYHRCHNPGLSGLEQWCFPNGEPLNNQPNYIPEVFDLITDEILKLNAHLKRVAEAKKPR